MRPGEDYGMRKPLARKHVAHAMEDFAIAVKVRKGHKKSSRQHSALSHAGFEPWLRSSYSNESSAQPCRQSSCGRSALFLCCFRCRLQLAPDDLHDAGRSEERRVGKECRLGWAG